ncbi:NIPSNAP family protein [Chloroflexi bacterium TSY]|nr:NIPSNAP family protein [Chloroflexi bacterium TSY]
MIYHVVTMKVLPDKGNEAEQILLKAQAYLEEKNPVENAQFLRGIDDSSNRLHISGLYDSLAAFETQREARHKDPEWKTILDELDAVVEDSEGHFYRVIMPPR